VSQVSTDVIGFAFAVNTAVIVGLQFFMLGRIAGHRRTRALIVMAGLWAGSWVVLGLTGLVPGTVLAALGVLTFHALFALGETLLQPTVPAITNDLAPDHLRGRYNAVNAGAFQGGTILGPVVAGFMLSHHWSTAFVVLVVLGCGLIGLLALVVERQITPAVNGITDDEAGSTSVPAPAAPGVTAAAEARSEVAQASSEVSGSRR
jgi:MFS family permease